jgi:hypothetical protein
MKANIYCAAADFVNARQAAAKALKNEPTLLEAHRASILVSLGEKKHEETLMLLKSMTERFPKEVGDLEKEPGYADFVKSPQYQQWLEYRAGK